MSKFFDISKLKTLATGLVASGKKNAPTLMTAGSIVAGWVGVYIFWKQSRKAEKRIEYEESNLNDAAVDEDCEYQKLPIKDKFSIYLQYCWMALLCGLGSTGLAIGADRLNISRLAEMALMVGFLNDKDGKQQALIEKLRAEVGNKKFDEMQSELREEKYPEDEIMEERLKVGPGSGKTLFIDEVTHTSFAANVEDVQKGINNFNLRLQKEYDKVKESYGNGPFLNDNESPFDTGPYSSVVLETFLKFIGELPMNRRNNFELGDLLEFKYYGGGKYHVHSDLVKWNQITSYDERFKDPETGLPVVVFLNYENLLSATNKLLDQSVYRL